MSDFERYHVWAVVVLFLALFGVLPLVFYVCARMAAIGRLSGERWFWLRHYERFAHEEKMSQSEERAEDEQ